MPDSENETCTKLIADRDSSCIHSAITLFSFESGPGLRVMFDLENWNIVIMKTYFSCLQYKIFQYRSISTEYIWSIIKCLDSIALDPVLFLFSTCSALLVESHFFPHNHGWTHFFNLFFIVVNWFLSMLKTNSCFILFFRKKVGRCRVKSLQGSRWSTIASVGRERCHLISCYYIVWSLWTSRMGFYEQASWSGKNVFFFSRRSVTVYFFCCLPFFLLKSYSCGCCQSLYLSTKTIVIK